MGRNLFDNLDVDRKTKDKSKELAKKAKKSTKKIISNPVASGNKIAQKINAIINAYNEGKILADEDEEKYKLITDKKELEDYIESINKNEIFALDTETTGLDPINDEAVGLCLYTPGQKRAYIPFGHCDLNDNLLENQLDINDIIEYLKMINNIKAVYHNAIFDMRISKRNFGIYFNPLWDTQIAGSYLNENESHRLKDTYIKYCGSEDEKSEGYKDLFSNVPFKYIPLEIAKIYGGKDGFMTYELYEFQKKYLNPRNDKYIEKDLKEAGKFFEEVELSLINIIMEMEERGVKIDKKYAKELSDKYQQKLKDAEDKLLDYISTLDFNDLSEDKMRKLKINDYMIEKGLSKNMIPINIGSDQQLSIIIYDVIGMSEEYKKTQTGVGEETLLKLRQNTKDEEIQEFIDNILEYRGIKKLLSTYINKLPKVIKEKTGKLHGRFNPYGTVTGRFSSSDPNLQNIPSNNQEIRKMFIAHDGYAFIAADYSQQEPRVLAQYANDEEMKKAYKEGKDLYAWISSIVYGLSYEQCLKDYNDDAKKRRDKIKMVVLAIMYGMGDYALAETLEISRKEAGEIKGKFFNAFPQVKKKVDKTISFAKENGYIKTLYGRKRRLTDINLPYYQIKTKEGKELDDSDVEDYYYKKLINADNRKKINDIKQEAWKNGIKVKDNTGFIAEAERQSINSIIQGTSADITKKAMLLIGTDEKLKELGFELLLTVHDEVIGEVPKENALEASERIKELMLQAPEDKIEVPMEIDIDIVERWYGEDIAEKLSV